MKEVTVVELKKLMDDHSEFQLIDVREEHEIDICEIGGDHIPMGDIMENLDKISKEKKVVVLCRSGARSGTICRALQAEGFDNVYNLKGGILAWADEIDSSMSKY